MAILDLHKEKICEWEKCQKSLYDKETGLYYKKFHPECAKARAQLEIEAKRFEIKDLDKTKSQYYVLREEIEQIKIVLNNLQHQINTIFDILNGGEQDE